MNKKFAILHLSDLHIVPHHGDSYSTVLNRMIDHILKVTDGIEKIIIAFTGDLVERGEFGRAHITIKKFWQDLNSKLGNKVVDVVFAPGNHDKVRGRLVLQGMVDESDENFWAKFKKDDWGYFENQFEDYKNIVNEIQREVFHVKEQGNSTYGIRTVEINGYKICFLCINSAWTCMGKMDEGNLRIGRFQLDELMGDYQSIRESVDLVVALMHHPTDWLMQNEQKYLSQYLTDEYRLNTNIMLQGHIHEKETYNWYNQNHSLTTLVTGMGWDQQKQIDDGGHRYSLYEIDMESCIVKVNTYVTDKGGHFGEDTVVYNGTNIAFPLFVHKYLELNGLKFKNSEIPLFYPSYNPAENLEVTANRINEFSLMMMDEVKERQIEWGLLDTLKRCISKLLLECVIENGINFIEEFQDVCSKDEVIRIVKQYANSLNNALENTSICEEIGERFATSIEDVDVTNLSRIQNRIETYLEQYTKMYLKDVFYSFIGAFCLNLGKKLFPPKEYNNGDKVRIHFRIISINKERKIIYKKLFAYMIIKENDEIQYVSEQENTKLTDIEYEGSMIQKSFEKKKSMLCSLNPSSNKHVSKGGWIDFITIAPNIDCNKYLDRSDIDENSLPYISFGISVNSENFQSIIRSAAYMEFDKILSRFMHKFFMSIPFDLNDLVKKEE